MVSTEASWWNILDLKTYTTLSHIVSLILSNLEHVFRFCIVSRITFGDDSSAKHVSQVQED